MKNKPVNCLSLVINTKKHDIAISSREDIKLHLKSLGSRGTTYACLCSLLNLDAPFIQVKLLSSKNYEIEYKDSQGFLYVSKRKNFTKLEIIDAFIAFFEAHDNFIGKLEWENLKLENSQGHGTKLQKKEFSLDLDYNGKHAITSNAHLMNLLTNIGTSGVSFAVLQEKIAGSLVQTAEVSGGRYSLEYFSAKGRHFEFTKNFSTIEICDIFSRFYQGDRRWTKEYGAVETNGYGCKTDNVENKLPFSFQFFLFIFALGLDLFVLDRFGKMGAFIIVASYCLFNFVFFLYRDSSLLLKTFDYFLFLASGINCVALCEDGVYAFFAIFITRLISVFCMFLNKWRR